MKNQQPEKIDVEKNPLGINFLKSKKVKKYFDENTFLWSSETTPGPVIGNKATLYTTSKRAMDLIKLEEQKICLLYTSPSPRDLSTSRMPSSA